MRETDIFAAWLQGLRDDQARARIAVRIRRLVFGNSGGGDKSTQNKDIATAKQLAKEIL